MLTRWRWFDDVVDLWELNPTVHHNVGASVSQIIEAMGAGQPRCKPGPAPANCTARLQFSKHDHWTNDCISHCDEVDKFLSVRRSNLSLFLSLSPSLVFCVSASLLPCFPVCVCVCVCVCLSLALSRTLSLSRARSLSLSLSLSLLM